MPAFFAHGTTFSFGDDGTDPIPVGGLTSIGLPEEEKERVEITSHDSAGDREYVGGLRDGGTVSLTARLIPSDAGQDALDDNYDATPTVNEECIITTPTTPAVTYTFQGFVESRGGEMPFDGPGEATWTVRIAGAVVKATA